MSEKLQSNAQKVQDVLTALGFSYQVVELSDTTRSAQEAAQAIGCQVAQIAKSLVFKTKHTNMPVLVVASGINRVNEKQLEEYISEPIEKANAKFVREKTGFAIGGVPPVGHKEQLKAFIDADLLQYEEIWAAAGHPHAVFKLTPEDLKIMTKGQVVSIK